MSLVNEALRKAAQQAAAQRTRESHDTLGLPPEPAHHPAPQRGGSPMAIFAIGGSTLVIGGLLIGVIIAIKSTGGPKLASAGVAPEPTTPPVATAPATEPAPPDEPATTDEPRRPLLEFRPTPTTDLEPVLPTAPVEPTTEPAPQPEPATPDDTELPWVNPKAETPDAEPVSEPTPAPAEPVKPKLRLVPEGEYLKTLDVADCPPLTLGAIIFSERLQAALINGRMVEAGSNVDGVKVETIEPKRVTLRSPLGTKFYMVMP